MLTDFIVASTRVALSRLEQAASERLREQLLEILGCEGRTRFASTCGILRTIRLTQLESVALDLADAIRRDGATIALDELGVPSNLVRVLREMALASAETDFGALMQELVQEFSQMAIGAGCTGMSCALKIGIEAALWCAGNSECEMSSLSDSRLADSVGQTFLKHYNVDMAGGVAKNDFSVMIGDVAQLVHAMQRRDARGVVAATLDVAANGLAERGIDLSDAMSDLVPHDMEIVSREVGLGGLSKIITERSISRVEWHNIVEDLAEGNGANDSLKCAASCVVSLGLRRRWHTNIDIDDYSGDRCLGRLRSPDKTAALDLLIELGGYLRDGRFDYARMTVLSYFENELLSTADFRVYVKVARILRIPASDWDDKDVMELLKVLSERSKYTRIASTFAALRVRKTAAISQQANSQNLIESLETQLETLEQDSSVTISEHSNLEPEIAEWTELFQELIASLDNREHESVVASDLHSIAVKLGISLTEEGDFNVGDFLALAGPNWMLAIPGVCNFTPDPDKCRSTLGPVIAALAPIVEATQREANTVEERENRRDAIAASLERIYELQVDRAERPRDWMGSFALSLHAGWARVLIDCDDPRLFATGAALGFALDSKSTGGTSKPGIWFHSQVNLFNTTSIASSVINAPDDENNENNEDGGGNAEEATLEDDFYWEDLFVPEVRVGMGFGSRRFPFALTFGLGGTRVEDEDGTRLKPTLLGGFSVTVPIVGMN